jgi:2-amino-4-hydroxy-6-hydroxymethyldihydropteridine diphosphokinase
MTDVYLSLGSNLGSKYENICAMIRDLSSISSSVVGLSDLMETEPLEVEGEQPWYLNVIMGILCEYPAHTLLDRCQEIERRLGRRREGYKTARTADIDILLFGNELIDDSRLTIPHPALMRRRFCVEGIVKINPDLKYPGSDKTINDLYRHGGFSNEEQEIRYVKSGRSMIKESGLIDGR